jgi:hypothetical protein
MHCTTSYLQYNYYHVTATACIENYSTVSAQLRHSKLLYKHFREQLAQVRYLVRADTSDSAVPVGHTVVICVL